MKTAEEWADTFFHENGLPIATPERIRRIQLDALREAAEIALKAIDENFHPNYHAAAMMIENAILARIKEVEG